MAIALDRNLCCDLKETISREWLVTNGRGGYAAGTVAGALTRMQHGLLVASLPHTTTPQLLLAKIDEEVLFDQRTYYLGTNEYQDGTLNPSGFAHLETFRLEEGFPVFTYRLGGIDGISLEKRIWMPHGQNTTYIQYRVLRSFPAEESVYSSRGQYNTTAASNSAERFHLHVYPEVAQRVLTLTLLPFSAYRPHYQPQYGNNDWHFQVDIHRSTEDSDAGSKGGSKPRITFPKGVAGCTIRAYEGAQPYHIFAVGQSESETTFIPTGVWYWHFLRRHDQAAMLPATDDLYLPCVISAKLRPGEDATLTIVVTAEELSTQMFTPKWLQLSYKRSVENQRNLLQPQRYFGEGGEITHALQVLPLTTSSSPDPTNPAPNGEGEEYLRLLLQAGERFLAQRRLPHDENQSNAFAYFLKTESIPLLLSDYFGMAESTRDMLIALPGLTLSTGRYDEAYSILRNLACYFRQGLLPDRLPTPEQPLEEHDYGSVDTTLWYFSALDHYLRVTSNYELLDELYPRLVDSIGWYTRGTYNGIQVDSHDGLLMAQQAGKALTWMNASVKGTPVTPREGKPVEVNALWYHALSLIQEWSQRLYHMGRINSIPLHYQKQSLQCKKSFRRRFWYADGGYLYDGIDGPDGPDSAMRPNQLLAFSLRYAVLDEKYREGIFDLVTQHLLTPYGLRTLAPEAPEYRGRLSDNEHPEEVQRALHQGSVWPWLIGPYIDAMFHLSHARTDAARNENLWQEYLWRKGVRTVEAFRTQLAVGMLGSIAGALDGDAPHHGGYQIASALSVGELLRTYNRLTHRAWQPPSGNMAFAREGPPSKPSLRKQR